MASEKLNIFLAACFRRSYSWIAAVNQKSKSVGTCKKKKPNKEVGQREWYKRSQELCQFKIYSCQESSQLAFRNLNLAGLCTTWKFLHQIQEQENKHQNRRKEEHLQIEKSNAEASWRQQNQECDLSGMGSVRKAANKMLLLEFLLNYVDGRGRRAVLYLQ